MQVSITKYSLESGGQADKEVVDFIENIWSEAIGQLDDVLVNVESIQPEQVQAF